jgi:hypothetical protein
MEGSFNSIFALIQAMNKFHGQPGKKETLHTFFKLLNLSSFLCLLKDDQ